MNIDKMKNKIDEVSNEIKRLSQLKRDLNEEIAKVFMTSEYITKLLDRTWRASYSGTNLTLRSENFEEDSNIIELFEDCADHSYRTIVRLPDSYIFLEEIEYSDTKYLEIRGSHNHSTANVVKLIMDRDLIVVELDIYINRVEGVIDELQDDVESVKALRQ